MKGDTQIVVGTAGHIDHGKSRLVMTLTGTDPDRLPEEKERGMTIDLGFAHTRISNCDVWLVDVPGHERFIRNMVAGATGVDGALLVVAADDSVMPQTREHVEVLAMLGVTRCVVAVTKIDLVDAELAELVEAEARDLLTSYDIEPVAVVHTSAKDGRGIDDLRQALLTLAAEKAADGGVPYTWFRLPIDRTFNIPGRGNRGHRLRRARPRAGGRRVGTLAGRPHGSRARFANTPRSHRQCDRPHAPGDQPGGPGSR